MSNARQVEQRSYMYLNDRVQGHTQRRRATATKWPPVMEQGTKWWS